jgi:hypothetical protein
MLQCVLNAIGVPQNAVKCVPQTNKKAKKKATPHIMQRAIMVHRIQFRTTVNGEQKMRL